MKWELLLSLLLLGGSITLLLASVLSPPYYSASSRGNIRPSPSPRLKGLASSSSSSSFLVTDPSSSSGDGPRSNIYDVSGAARPTIASDPVEASKQQASLVKQLSTLENSYRAISFQKASLAQQRHAILSKIDKYQHVRLRDAPSLDEEDEDESATTHRAPAVPYRSLAKRAESAPKASCPKLYDNQPNTVDDDAACRRLPPQLEKDDGDALNFKVYVYDLPSKFNRDMSKKYKRCATDQYGTEVFFHEALLSSTLRTRDPDKADFFFVPVYGECFLWQYEMLRHEGREKSFGLTNDLYLDALRIVREQHPHWNRTNGADHIFSFPGARGPTIFSEWEKHIKQSIYLTPEGDRKAHYFNTWKDIVVPGLEASPIFYLPKERERLLAREGKPRKYLAYFRGTIDHREGWAYSRGLRPRLKKLLNASDIIYDTKHSTCDRQCYHNEMAESVFCLNPLGWTPWTLRFYQAVMTRCIPVVIADDIEFPYENEIDYSKFAVKIRERDVDNIVEFMRNMPEAEKEARRREMDRIWLMFSYQRPPVPGDAFHATMREIGRKRVSFRTGPLHEWS
ncbi:glycosyltransferase family 47 protein [Pseudoscourfieldia marina]